MSFPGFLGLLTLVLCCCDWKRHLVWFSFLKLVKTCLWPTCDTWMFSVCLRRVCILVLLGECFECLLGPTEVWCYSSPPFSYWSVWVYPLLKWDIEIYHYCVTVSAFSSMNAFHMCGCPNVKYIYIYNCNMFLMNWPFIAFFLVYKKIFNWCIAIVFFIYSKVIQFYTYFFIWFI